MNFTLIYWIDDGWYIGKLKEVPGVFSQGETFEELKENIADAYRLIMEDDSVLPAGNIKTADIHQALDLKEAMNEW